MNTYSRKRSHLAEEPSGNWQTRRFSPDPTPKLCIRNTRKCTTTSLQLARHESCGLSHSRSTERLCEPSKKRIRLVQTTIDLNKRTKRTCDHCGMQYVLTSLEDVKIHKRFCADLARSFIGVPISQQELSGAKKLRLNTRRQTVSTATYGDDFIVEISRRSSPNAKLFAERVLATAENELGAVHITRERLWSMNCTPPLPWSKLQKDDLHDSFKIFLYISQSRCIGLCLGQNITRATRIMKNTETGPHSRDRRSQASSAPSNCTSESLSSGPADRSIGNIKMGISRIWVVSGARGSGIASDLLDVSKAHFLLGRALSRSEVAFSQPTESGRRLARKWHGHSDAWYIYDDFEPRV